MSRHHCQQRFAVTPQTFMAVLGLIAGLSVFIGLVFWTIGAPWVLPFALLESVVLVLAFVCHARSIGAALQSARRYKLTN